jgi:uncharacterized membrane protein
MNAELLLWTLFYLLAPALIIYLAYTIDSVSKLGTIVVAYALGLVIGNIGVLPENIATVQNALTTLTVPVALPLLFFSLELGRWKVLAKKSLLSLVAALISITIASVIAFLVFARYIGPEGWKAGGMLVGVYTGGTPNLAAIGNALRIDPIVYVSVHGSDVVASAFILLFLISAAPRLYAKVLPAFRHEGEDEEQYSTFSPYFTGASLPEIREMLGALGLALVIFAAGGSFTLFLPEASALPAAILTITTLGIAASFVPRVRRLRNSFQLGYYLILVFSIAVSSMANVRELTVTAPVILLYVASLLVIVSIIHLGLSALFRIDTDTHIITATSFIFSPPFVPVVAAAIGNRKVVVPGVLIGVTGWVLGNYIGFAVAYLLRWLV